MRTLWVYPEKCTGCSLCVLSCSFAKTGEYSPRDALLQVLSWEERCLTVPIVCAQCEDAPCQSACPEDAISRSSATEAVVVDAGLCTACGLCTEACPTGSIFVHRRSNAATKCDLCDGEPVCVKVCYPEALQFEEREWAERLKQRHQCVESKEAHCKQELPGFPIMVKE
jgi:carbon-monoxide dehydrogenase iron sulfur subunit